MIHGDLLEETARRYEERSEERHFARSSLARGDVATANNPERFQARLERLGVNSAQVLAATSGRETLKGVLAAALPAAAVNRFESTRVGLERVLGNNDLIGISFLDRGVRASAAVGCVASLDMRGFGTGFRISPQLLLTNNHVLPDKETARASEVVFRFQVGLDGDLIRGEPFVLDPKAFFQTNEQLDFTLVAIKPESVNRQLLDDVGWVKLDATQGKVLIGEFVNIIQHPNGEPKQLALRENCVVDIIDGDNFIHYKTDTAPGSSGSPVFNDQWEVVALHHSGVPNRDPDGNILTRDGAVWHDSMGEHKIHWIANEGVRVSQIVRTLRELTLSGEEARLLAGVFDGTPPPTSPSAPVVRPPRGDKPGPSSAGGTAPRSPQPARPDPTRPSPANRIRRGESVAERRARRDAR